MNFKSILLALGLAFFPISSWALTGGVGGKIDQKDDYSEEEVLELMDVASKLREVAPEVSTDDSLSLAALLKDVSKDEQTALIKEDLERAKIAQDPQYVATFEGATPKEIVVSLHQILDELKALEVLFKDPARAVEELYKDGMVEDEERLQLYRENPAQMEEDMRSGLYIWFVSLAHQGQWL